MRKQSEIQARDDFRCGKIIEWTTGQELCSREIYEKFSEIGIQKSDNSDLLHRLILKIKGRVRIVRWHGGIAFYRAEAGTDEPRPLLTPEERRQRKRDDNRIRLARESASKTNVYADLPIRRSGAIVKIRPYQDLPREFFGSCA